MEIKVNALVLRAIDYKDNDKILTLLTAEKGKLSAGIKGVKKAGAKLKFAAQPLCFAEYVLNEKGGKYTVINASECESFYELRTDFCKLYPAFAICEIAQVLTYEGEENKDVLYSAINALTQICNGDADVALLTFFMNALAFAGYGVLPTDCIDCGESLITAEKMKFDLSTGTFRCWECGEGLGVSGTTFNTLRKVAGKEFNAQKITPDGVKRALKLLREYCLFKVDAKFSALDEYIKSL